MENTIELRYTSSIYSITYKGNEYSLSVISDVIGS